MKNKILKIFKLIIWLFFGTFLFIFRFRELYSVYSYTYESRLMKSGYKKASILILFFTTVIVNVIVWLIIYFLCKK